ncbi:MAG TPA: right-handed parallel beta-helix repeat-containing protein [Burkholderiales bacterium]|nr:right-handed parallel beta-helix repeat-containing protein [Burkholderiales bacterium]
MIRLLLAGLIGSAALLAPAVAAVRVVDPAHPAARDAGDGGKAQPYVTLGYAMKRLQAGDTLYIAPGTYRESLIFPERDWSGAPTSVQPAGKGTVLVKGSDVVTGWKRLEDGLYVKRPWKFNSQQVYVAGQPLRQIGGTILNGYPERADHPMKKLHAGQGGIWPGRVPGGREQLAPGSFFYDAAEQSLYVRVAPGASLDGRIVEVSVRPYLALAKGIKGLIFTGLTFQHANTTAVSQAAAVSLTGDRMVIDGIEVRDVDGNGLDISGDGNVVRNSRAIFCGQVGMKIRGRANKVIDNETSFNNTRGFNKWWEAGGAKFVGNGGLRDSEVRGHRAIGNRGDGIWFDWMNSNNKIHGNVAAYNSGFGIHYEASRQGYIYNNFVFGNRQRGIYLPNSSESLVAYNLVVANGSEGIVVVDEGRRSSKKDLLPRSNRVLGNIIAWNAKAALVIPPQDLDNASDYNLYLSRSEPPTFSSGWPSRASPLRQGLAAWRNASGQDQNSWHEHLQPPPNLAAALDSRDPAPDWSTVMKFASRFSVLMADSAEARGPMLGPQLTPGPRP